MRKIFFVLVCCMACVLATASPITAEQAREAAAKFLNRKVTARRAAQQTALHQPMAFDTAADGQPMVYAVNIGQDEGFVLVSGSDLGDEIIGYCDHGTFNELSMPENMRSWLTAYAEGLRQMEAAGMKPSHRAQRVRPAKNSIKPMLATQWNQDDPYNAMCPIVKGNRTFTGCTITATAQVLYYHKWPASTLETIPAYNPTNPDFTQLPALEPTTFDWSRMYPSYKYKEDGTEVAKLMIYLGTAAKGNYTEKNTGANLTEMTNALKKYFGYSSDAKHIFRSNFSYEQWVDMLYEELAARRPVLFTGYSVRAGHTFVLDGYDEEDFFHVNWGWGGSSDGYFKVVTLNNTEESGTGSGGDINEAYSMTQSAVFGLQPSKSPEVQKPAALTVNDAKLYKYTDSNYNYNVIGYESSSPFFKSGYYFYAAAGVSNYTGSPRAFDIGVRLTKNDGSVTRDYEWKLYNNKNYNEGAGYTNDNMAKDAVYFNPVTDAALTDGDYTIYFISKESEATEWQLDENAQYYSVSMRLDHAHKQATYYVPNIELTAENVIIPGSHAKVGEPFVITLTAKNTGTKPYHNIIGLKDKDISENAFVAGGTFDIEAGQQKDITINYIPKDAGEKHLMLMAASDITLKDNINIVVEQSDKNSLVDLTFSQQMANAEGAEVIGPTALVDVTVTNNNDKSYKGFVFLGTWEWDVAGNGCDEYTMKEVEIEAHGKKVVRFISKALKDGEKYSFTTGYYKGENPIHDLSQKENYYTTVSYYTVYDADGKASNFKSKGASITLTAKQCAIDMRNATGIANINVNANPNALIFANSDTDIKGNNIVKDMKGENIVLTDGYPFFNPFDFEARQVTYTRMPDIYCKTVQGNTTGWSTLTLPFAATGCQTEKSTLNWATKTAYGHLWVAEFSQENGNMMTFDYPGATLDAYRPYLFGVPGKSFGESSLEGEAITFYSLNAVMPASGKAVTTIDLYKMVGTVGGVADKADIYLLNAEGTAFVRSTASASPFRAYFAPTSPMAQDTQLDFIIVDNTTGIRNVNGNENENGNADWYDLQGRRVSHSPSSLQPSRSTLKKGIYIVNGKKVIR